MGQIHNELKRSPIADGIKTAIGQHKQGEGGLERWGETLTPVINAWGMPEWAYLRKERLGCIAGFAAAVPAEFGYCGIGNPLDSGVIVVVDAVSYIVSAASQAILSIGPHTAIVGTVVTTPGIASLRDRRWAGTAGRTFFVTGTDGNAGLLTSLEAGNGGAVTFGTFTVCLPLILRPGDDLAVVVSTVNIAVTANFGWRERKAFPGELS